MLPVASDWQSHTLPPRPLLDQPPGLVCDGKPHKSGSFIISPQMQPQRPEAQFDEHGQLMFVLQKLARLEEECSILRHGHQSVQSLVSEFEVRAQQMIETQSAASAAAERARKAASEAHISAMAALKAKVDATQQAESAHASAEVLQTSAFLSVKSDVHQHHYQQRHHPSGGSLTEEAPFQ